MKQSAFVALSVLAGCVIGCDGGGDEVRLAASPGLFAVDPAAKVLYTVDLRDGSSTPISNVAFQDIQCLAYDAEASIVYGVDNDTDQLVAIRPTNDTGVTIGPLGFSAVTGLAFDPIRRILYGADSDTYTLIRIDTNSGVGSAIGSLGVRIGGLTFRPETNTLLATDKPPLFCCASLLYEIEPDTAAVTILGGFRGGPPSTGYSPIEGLAYDRYLRRLYGTLWGSLYEIDISTGWGTLVDYVGTGPVDGLSAW